MFELFCKKVYTNYFILALGLVLLCIGAAHLYKLPLLDSVKFLVATFFILFIPGNVLVIMASLSTPFNGSRLIHSLAVGIIVTPLIFLVQRRLGFSDGFAIGILLIFLLFWVFQKLNECRESSSKDENTYRDILPLVVLLLVVLLMLHLSHFTDVILSSEQEYLLRTTHLTETIFHLGIVNSLTDGFPPPSLYASGVVDFSYYHLGMHLQIESFANYFNIDSVRLIHFYFPFLYLACLTSSAYSLLRAMEAGRFTAFVGSLLIYGSGLSYIPGFNTGLEFNEPWIVFFVPSIWSLFTANGFMVALIGLFIFPLILLDFLVYQKFAKLYLLVLVLLGTFVLKNTMGLQLAGVSAFIGVFLYVSRNKKSGLMLFLASSSCIAVMLIYIAIFAVGATKNVVEFEPFILFTNTLRAANLADLAWWQYPIAYAIFIIFVFGTRVVSYFAVRTVQWENVSLTWINLFIITFTISGFLLSDMVFIGTPTPGSYNNGIWFAVQSLYAAWILVALFLSRIEHRPLIHFVVSIVIIVLSVPSTIQFFTIRYDQSYTAITKEDLEVVEFLKRTPHDAVVLHEPNEFRPSLASNLAGRQSVLSIFASMVDSDTENQRQPDIELFFKYQTTSAKRSRILSEYSVDFVYSSQEAARFLGSQPELTLLMENSHYSVYTTH